MFSPLRNLPFSRPLFSRNRSKVFFKANFIGTRFASTATPTPAPWESGARPEWTEEDLQKARKKSVITGFILGASVFAIYAYTMFSVSRNDLSAYEEERKLVTSTLPPTSKSQ